MKIAISGLFNYYMYEEVCAEVLEKNGCEVVRIPFGKLAKTKLGKLEFHFSFKFLICFYYSLKLCFILKRTNPDVLLCWRTTWIFDWALKYAKSMGTKLVSYNNDDPFSPHYSKGNLHQQRLWRNFLRQIPLYDINLVYRPVNVEEYKNAGGRNVHLWMPYYIPREIDNAPPAFEGKPIDVIFIGHWEKHREETIQYLIDNELVVKIFGTGWQKSNLSFKNEIKPLYGKDYFGYIKSSKVALAFLSKLNRDEYTRRNFEIPACGTIMISEKTEYLVKIFKQQNNIKFFENKEELLYLINNVLQNYHLFIGDCKNFSVHSIHNRINLFLKFITE